MGERRLSAAALLLLFLLGPSCGPKTPAEEAGIDQEITRNILWRYHNDLRFADVRVQCENREITVEGRVGPEGEKFINAQFSQAMRISGVTLPRIVGCMK